ncbi:AMP-binding protein [Nocardia fluminea]|uniref:AMP-binding protein n=1 Tax=Nocardia fluminea TaxID=134984 RepID=UPI0034125AC3
MPENLAALLMRRVQERPDLRLGTVDDQVTLDVALRRAAGGAAQLRNLGLAAPDRVALVASSSTDYLIVWQACLLAGIPVALINPTYPSELLAQMIEILDPRLVITDAEDASFAGSRYVWSLNEVTTWVDGDPDDCPGLSVDPSAIASFMHTSGTTGVPKFCAQTHMYFLRLGRAMSESLGLTPKDRMLAPLPLFHINPLGYGIVGALTAGADALTVRKFSARGFWPDVREHAITALALHAPPVEILKRATNGADADGHAVRTMFYADREFMTRFGIGQAVSGYGSTEAAGVSHLHQWRLGDDIPDDASRHGGTPRGDVEDRITEEGEIQVRERAPHTLFAGYFGAGRVSVAVDSEGWFATGDLGRRTPNGDLVFLERAAESIRVKGEFVPIPYVEEQFGKVAQLEDLALWKRPGDLVDDEIVLFVVADELPMEHLRTVSATLPAFMRPSWIAQVASIPRDAAAGKSQRRLLHQQEVTSWTQMS